MSLFVQSAQNSALLAYLQPQTNPFEYNLKKNFTCFGKQKTVILDGGTQAYGSCTRFALPRYGPLRRLTLRAEVTVTEDITTDAFSILGAIESVRITATGDRTVATQWGDTIADWVRSQPSETRAVWLDGGHLRTGRDGTVLSAGTVAFDIPLPWSYTHSLQHTINARHTEPLEVCVRTSESAAAWASPSSGVGDVRLHLYCEYIELALETEQRWLSIPHHPRLQWDVYRETPVAVTTGDTQTIVPITCLNPTFRTLIICKSGNFSLDTRTTGSTQRIQLRHGDIDIVDSTAAAVQVQMVTPPFRYHADSEVFALQFSETPDGTEQTGVASFRNMVYPHIIVHHASASTGQSVQVYHYFHVLERTSLQDGVLRQRILS